MFSLLTVARAYAQVDVSAWPQVQMEVLVMDNHDDAVAGLSKENITVKENGQSQVVDGLLPVNAPQSVCVMIDTSGSTSQRKDDVHAMAQRFVQGLPLEDEVCVATFGWSLKMVQPLTEDRKAALAAVAGPMPAAGGTTLRDRLLQVMKYMRGSAKYSSRAILVITDGDDNASNANTEQTQRKMASAGSPMAHFLIVPESTSSDRDRAEERHIEKDTLNLSGTSGGLSYFPRNRKEMEAAVDHLNDAMKRRYLLQYETTAPSKDGQERRLELRMRGSKLTVRAPERYIAPAQ